MFLTQSVPGGLPEKRTWRANEGDLMTMAADLFSKIEEFLSLARLLNLTLAEEHTLMSLEAEEWQRWRTLSVPANTLAPSLLVRRLDYAIALLRRMAAASSPGTSWTGPHESHL
jgi:hypothetical protein